MKLIPVIDLKGGQVVAARMGNRSAYAPLVSSLCGSSRLDEVTSGLLRLHPFETLYIADLDAIAGDGSHLEAIRALSAAHPGLTLWVDAGLAGLDAVGELARPVLGSESLVRTDQLSRLIRRLRAPILSLDFRAERLVGPKGLELEPALWPEEVIVMTISRVGSGSGPDVPLLERLLRAAPGKHFYAAGGVRGAADLRRLRKIGAAGALVSTALHNGRIGPEDVRSLHALRPNDPA